MKNHVSIRVNHKNFLCPVGCRKSAWFTLVFGSCNGKCKDCFMDHSCLSARTYKIKRLLALKYLLHKHIDGKS